MNGKVKILTVSAFAFVLGLSINNFAVSSVPASFNVAVVDVAKIANSSHQLTQVKNEQQEKLDNLAKYIADARKNLSAEKDAKKQKVLEEKYSKEIDAKKATIDSDYSKKLAEVDKNLRDVIKAKATKDKYDLVLNKNIVIVGGTDITDQITKLVK